MGRTRYATTQVLNDEGQKLKGLYYALFRSKVEYVKTKKNIIKSKIKDLKLMAP